MAIDPLFIPPDFGAKEASLLVSPYGFRKGPFDCPFTDLQSGPKGCHLQSEFVGPFHKGLGFIAKCYQSIYSAIYGLLSSRSPAHVAGLVIPIFIYTIQRMYGGWPRPHVLKESVKAGPSFTNLDAATAIKRIASSRLFGATTAHVDPSVICRRAGHPMSDVVFGHNWHYKPCGIAMQGEYAYD